MPVIPASIDIFDTFPDSVIYQLLKLLKSQFWYLNRTQLYIGWPGITRRSPRSHGQREIAVWGDGAGVPDGVSDTLWPTGRV